MKFQLCRAFALVLFLCFPAAGDDETSAAHSGWQRLFREQAAGYRISVGELGEAKLEPYYCSTVETRASPERE